MTINFIKNTKKNSKKKHLKYHNFTELQKKATVLS